MGRITGLIALLLLFPVLCMAQPDYCLSSGTKTQAAADTVAVSSVPAKLCGVIIQTNGSDDATVEVWDDTADDEDQTVLFNMTVTGGDNRGGAIFAMPIAALNGLYLDFNGCTGCSAEVYYQP